MVLPDARPFETSRGVRVAVARGSIEYSAVTQPFPEPRRNPGTDSSIDAAHSTRVLPISISTEPSAVSRYSVVIVTGRIWPGSRWSTLISLHFSRFHRTAGTPARTPG